MENDKPFVTVYTLAYNEEALVEFAVKFYRKMFPNCIINIYDNYSTDRTAEIAEKLGCNVIKFDTGGTFHDGVHVDLKNSIWKDATTDWVIVNDFDEFPYITQDELKYEESRGYNVIRFTPYNMMGKGDDIDLNAIDEGFYDDCYYKFILFNKSQIAEMNYPYGAHASMGHISKVRPKKPGKPVNLGASKEYKLLHYKFINLEYTIKRQLMYDKRWSDFNLNKIWRTATHEQKHPPISHWEGIYEKETIKVLDKPIFENGELENQLRNSDLEW